MECRLNTYEIAPEIPKHARALQTTIEATGVDKSLVALIQLRASQINGCAYCLHVHTREARRAGESETRIYLLSAFRESTLFTPRERAVLEWTEALTRVADHGAPHAAYEALTEHFSELEIVGITHAVAMINFLNRVAIGLHYVSPHESRAVGERRAAV